MVKKLFFNVDFFQFNTKNKDTAVANYAEMIFEELSKYDEIELEKIGLNNKYKYLYCELIRPIETLKGKFLSLRNPDSLIVPRGSSTLVYDTIPYDISTGWKALYFMIRYRLWLKHCKWIFTFSESIRKRLIEIYGVGAENIASKIIVLPPFIDQAYINQSVSGCNVDANGLEMTNNYIVGFGTGEPRKNITRTLDLFKKSLYIDSELKLVLFGGNWRGIGHKIVSEEIKRFDLTDKVIHLGRIDLKRLISLYTGSQFVIFPSENEGVGLPPFEALACGAKVIISDIPIFREYFSDYSNVCFVSLTNTENDMEILEKILRMPMSPTDCMRIVNAHSVKVTVKIMHEYLLKENI